MIRIRSLATANVLYNTRFASTQVSCPYKMTVTRSTTGTMADMVATTTSTSLAMSSTCSGLRSQDTLGEMAGQSGAAGTLAIKRLATFMGSRPEQVPACLLATMERTSQKSRTRETSRQPCFETQELLIANEHSAVGLLSRGASFHTRHVSPGLNY